MALRHDGEISAADYADWKLIEQLAQEAEALLRPALAAVDRLYSGYGDAFGVLYRLSPVLMSLRREAGTMRGIAQMAHNRASHCRVAQLRAQHTPLWLLRSDRLEEKRES